MGPDRLPRTLVPMKAASGDLPTGEDWTYEVKWDGMRAVAFVDNGMQRIQSSTERDVTGSWPELAGLAAALPAAAALLDGELIATDDQGRPSFGLLQQRMHIANHAEAARRAAEQPIVYVVFDLLHLDGNDLTSLPLRDRRRLLDQVLEPAPAWRLSPLHDDGEALLAAAREQRLEGVVAKRLDAGYEPGRRSGAWRKVKVRRRQEMVIGGWIPGEGGRAGQIGALLVGYHDTAGEGGPLHFAGRVGTGFTDAELIRLPGLLDPLTTDRCPFDPPPPRADLARGATWVRPELVAELAFAEWTSDDRLRHPSYLGLRSDKAAVDVTRAE
ncbi:MAG: non-homologous end-joining DNA ligase [Acidimicrobiales bacterium]